MGILNNKAAMPTQQGKQVAGQNIPAPIGGKPAPLGVPKAPAQPVPTVANIPEQATPEAVNAQAEGEVAERDVKVYVNDFTDDDKNTIRQHVSEKVEAALASADGLSTMQLCHLCFVSPTSIKSRGKDTKSASEIVRGQYAGTKRNGAVSKVEKALSNADAILAAYVKGLNTPEKLQEYINTVSDPVKMAALRKSLGIG